MLREGKAKVLNENKFKRLLKVVVAELHTLRNE